MPLRVRVMRAAEPLAAALAKLLSALIAGFIHARNSLTRMFLRLYGGCSGHRSSSAMHAARKGGQRAGATTPTLFTPLHAIYTRPSAVAAILRTVPPPEGIFSRAMASVLGSKRTSVFGITPDSLYHTIPSGVMAMPYGWDFAPPGDGHTFTSPVFGSSRPRLPPSKSVKYTRSCPSIASRPGRTPVGRGYSWMSMVLGLMLPSLLVKNMQKKGAPWLLTCMP